MGLSFAKELTTLLYRLSSRYVLDLLSFSAHMHVRMEMMNYMYFELIVLI